MVQLECSKSINITDDIRVVKLDRIEEEEFTEDHPKVIEFTHFFRNRANVEPIFGELSHACRRDPELASLVVGSWWMQFTEMVPWVLCS